MTAPRLSILIPSIPSRWDKARALYNDLMDMIGDKDIEVLLLMDNKQRTIGEKREALKNIANGKYFMFVDDDDSLYSVHEIYEATRNDVDVITFKSKCRNSDGSEYIVTFGLKNDIEHNTEDGRYLDSKRPPFTQCAWSSHFKKYSYPASNYGEDWEWVAKCLATAFLETHIDAVLHGYNFDPEVSEAVVETWTNGKLSIKDLVRDDLLMNQPIIGPPRRCVVNYSTRQYWKGQERLSNSLAGKIDVLLYNEFTLDVPNKDPYSFKIFAIRKAREQGYEQILWLDASVYSVGSIEPVFNWLTKHVIFMEEAGHYAGTWSPTRVLNYFGITKEEADRMPMFSAGLVGFDFRHEEAKRFFAAWATAMDNGMFAGNHAESRHDMSAGSIIANMAGLVERYSPGGQFFAYIGPGYSEPKETVVFHLQGL